jgi:hypothetical protein
LPGQTPQAGFHTKRSPRRRSSGACAGDQPCLGPMPRNCARQRGSGVGAVPAPVEDLDRGPAGAPGLRLDDEGAESDCPTGGSMSCWTLGRHSSAPGHLARSLAAT